MKLWRAVLIAAVTLVAVLLTTSVVFAAPVAVKGAPIDRVFDDPDPVLTDTLPTTHPVGSLIALYFNIPYTQVMALRAEGFGFGTIARAYLTARQSNGALTPEQVLALRQTGTGWGQIKQDYGVHPGGNGLGTIVRGHGTPQPTTQPPGGPSDNDKQNKKDKGGNPGSAGCPGNSCNAPGNAKPDKGPKK